MTRVVVAAHFPPPVHGMAVAVDSLVSEMERSVPVHRVNIAAPALHRGGAGYHLVRAGRVLRALGVLARERRRTEVAFFSCDAGVGMLYTLVMTVAARALGFRTLLQHHSYAYLHRRSRLMAAIVRVAGPRSVHLVTAAQMQADFLAVHPGATTRVVGIARDLPVADAPGRAPGERLVLGFLGNVTVEKGIGLALDTARAAARAGVPVELRVAGPADAAAAELLRTAGAGVTLLGPVYGPDRDAFLDGIDVFLFPSQYVNESFGLVAWEAMARGRPVIAHRSGCLTADAVDGGGLVVERDDDFAARAVPLLAAWRDDPHALLAAGRRAHAVAASVAETSRAEVERLCADLAGRAAGRLSSSLSAPRIEGDARP